MFSHWPIRYKLLSGTAILFLIVAILSFSGFRGVYEYRELVRGISLRAMELEPASELTLRIGQLQATLPQMQVLADLTGRQRSDIGIMRANFEISLGAVGAALHKYQRALETGEADDPFMGDKRHEWETVREVEHRLARIRYLYEKRDWLLEPIDLRDLEEEVESLADATNQLPKFLQHKMLVFRDHVRVQYRTWIALAWIASLSTVVGLCALVRLFYVWVFRPMRILIDGSRRVAAGDFSHRIVLTNHDEVAELAAAMNAMTTRFEQIRDDLDEQVRQRTREVVRSEQLASVGFLAAGVAHEINNPLASIAWSAESLESRLHDILHDDGDLEESTSEQQEVLRKYLRRIQDEAFRCKGITERLLDFSRLGDLQRQDTDLRELIVGVIDMVKHLGRYRGKTIEFRCRQRVTAPVNAQEIKQVVLNLITNALDSLDPEGSVVLDLEHNEQYAVLSVTDNGAGMTPEVLDHIFEPFFTRKRGGQGTGLGLSITYRIVTDHGGAIRATSDGPGKGARFDVTLPLSHHEEENQRTRVAA